MHPVTRVHIEGMGLQGCLLSDHLVNEKSQYKLSWNDTDAPINAWQASTGAIYPANSTKFGEDALCYTQWRVWWERLRFPRDVLERCSFWFNHKKPPHEGKYGIAKETLDGALRQASLPSFHFNAQTFVARTREQLARYRVDGVPGDAGVSIVAHGFGDRLSHAYWGWTKLVKLDYDHDVFEEPGLDMRPAFYLREGRFIMAYAYPCPGTDLWYAGSSIIKQPRGKLRPLTVEDKFDRWRKNFERLAGGNVVVRDTATPFMQGWRPAPAEGDTQWTTRTVDNLLLRPLWNSGIRHWPQQLASLQEVMS